MVSRYKKGLGHGYWRGESVRHGLARKRIKTRNIDKIDPYHYFDVTGHFPQYAKPKIDLKRYSGKWYQISANPNWFQKGCSHATAEYKILDNGDVKVINSCSKDGMKSSASAIGKSVSADNRKLEIEFFPFIKGDYNILFTDYKNSVVGSSDKKYLWILSRKKQISKPDYDRLISVAKSKGYDTSRLQK